MKYARTEIKNRGNVTKCLTNKMDNRRQPDDFQQTDDKTAFNCIAAGNVNMQC